MRCIYIVNTVYITPIDKHMFFNSSSKIIK